MHLVGADILRSQGEKHRRLAFYVAKGQHYCRPFACVQIRLDSGLGHLEQSVKNEKMKLVLQIYLVLIFLSAGEGVQGSRLMTGRDAWQGLRSTYLSATRKRTSEERPKSGDDTILFRAMSNEAGRGRLGHSLNEYSVCQEQKSLASARYVGASPGASVL
jgi:hypothetical protein